MMKNKLFTTVLLMVMAFASQALLATNFEVTGASDPGVDGLYLEDGQMNGKVFYSRTSGSFTYAIGWDGSQWVMGPFTPPSSIFGIYHNTSTSNTCPTSTWQVYDVHTVPPAPTVTELPPSNTYYLDPDGTGDGSSWALAAASWASLIANQTLSDYDSVLCAVGTFDQADGTGNEIEITTTLTIIGGRQNPENPSTDTETIFKVETPGTSTYRVFNISGNGKTVNIKNITIKGGDVSGISYPNYDGACIIHDGSTLNIDNTTLMDGKAKGGGGIYSGNGTLSISNSTICNNTATGNGGGIYDYNSELIISATCIHNNSTDGQGGGLNIAIEDCEPFEIVNTTIYGNISDEQGGGIIMQRLDGTIAGAIYNSTIAGNHCNNDDFGTQYGGGISNQGISLTIKNTIIANNYYGSGTTTPDDYFSGSKPTDHGYNVIGYCNAAANGNGFDNANTILYNTKYNSSSTTETEWTQGGTALSIQTLNLAATLADNGGFTQTLAFTGESFAAASTTTGIPYGMLSPHWNRSPETDQRGEARAANQYTAIGAYAENYYTEISWTGVGNTDWDNSLNWNPGSVPGAYNNVTIPAFSSNQYPILSTGNQATCNNLTLNGGTSLTIESGGSLITYGTITNNGTIDVKQDFSNAEQWKLISSPCAGLTANTFIGMYLQQWNEPDGDWDDVGDETSALTPVKGFSFFDTDYESGGKPTGYSITYTGTPNTGDQSLDITASGAGDYTGANLVGNPYPSYLDWDEVTGYGAKYTWNGSGYDQYVYVDGSGYGEGTRYVEPMEGFFIVTASATTFSLNNNMRTHTSAKKTGSKDLQKGLVLSASGNDYNDELWLVFDKQTSENFELQRDAWKLLSSSPGIPQLWSLSSDGKLSIDIRPECEIIQLGFSNNQAGFYSIGIKDITDISNAYLEDTKTGTFHNLTESDYEFIWEITDNEMRFKLHLNVVGIEETPTDESNMLIYAADGYIYIKAAVEHAPLHAAITVTDVMGRVFIKQNINLSALVTIPVNLHTGVYVVMVQSATEHAPLHKTEKVFIK